MILIFLYLENESKEDLFNQNQTSVSKQPEESWSVNPSIHKQVTFEFFSPWVYKKKKHNPKLSFSLIYIVNNTKRLQFN